MMELFLEFVFTVSLSLVLSFILAKLLSLSSAIDQHLEAVSRSCMEATTKSEKHVFECEKGIGFVSEVVEESLNGSYGSTKVANQETVEETSCGDEENFVNETTEIEPAKEVEEEEEIEVLECEKENGEDQLQGVLTDDDDDDWEGIERSALEKDFAAALCRSNADDQTLKLGNDVKMQLYGLHKIATQGPCHDPQPMALKLSARAKWNAWKRLGNMSPEAAMEQYISLVSRSIPNEWMQDDDICVASWKLPLDVKTMPADQAIAVDYWTSNRSIISVAGMLHQSALIQEISQLQITMDKEFAFRNNIYLEFLLSYLYPKYMCSVNKELTIYLSNNIDTTHS